MTSPSRPAVARWAQQFLQSTLPLWPRESRDWGCAMVAEAAQIDRPLEAVRWTLGGLTFFLRSLGAHFWAWTRLPAGVNSDSAFSGDEPPLLPKHTRRTTAAFFVVAALMLLLPWGREALSGVSDFWFSFGDLDRASRELEALATRAQQGKDPRTLAFAAITYPDATRGLQLASEAVSLDPSLTWIYSSHFGYGGMSVVPSDLLATLQSYDPQNGFIYLLVANDRAEAAYTALINRHTPQEGEFEELLARDSEWLDLMHRAVSAPKYDTYWFHRSELVRDVTMRQPSLSPVVLIHSRWTIRIPELLFLRDYLKLQARQSQIAQSRGDRQAAEQSLTELRDFGARMTDAGQTEMEQLSGLEVTGQCLTALRSLYAASHRLKDAQSAENAMAALEPRRLTLTTRWDHKQYSAVISRYKRPAREVQVSMLVLVLGVFSAGASLVFLEIAALLPAIRRKLINRLACALVDSVPVLLPIAALGLLLSYRPFAAATEEFRKGAGVFADGRYFPGVFFVLQTASPGRPFFYFEDNFWWFATIALSAIAILITVRGIIRRPAA